MANRRQIVIITMGSSNGFIMNMVYQLRPTGIGFVFEYTPGEYFVKLRPAGKSPVFGYRRYILRPRKVIGETDDKIVFAED
jgi:hypothetical protein